jgi:hypothetical protein
MRCCAALRLPRAELLSWAKQQLGPSCLEVRDRFGRSDLLLCQAARCVVAQLPVKSDRWR